MEEIDELLALEARAVETCESCGAAKPMKKYVVAFDVSVCYACSKAEPSIYGTTAATSAKKDFMLRDEDLRGLRVMVVENIKYGGTSRLFLNRDLRAARDKRFPGDELQAEVARRAAASTKRKRKANIVVAESADKNILERAYQKLEGSADAATRESSRRKFAADDSRCVHEFIDDVCARCGLTQEVEYL